MFQADGKRWRNSGSIQSELVEMTMTDPLSDMLTRIRNANQVLKSEVEMPSSNLKEALAGVLHKEGYIAGFKVRKNEDEAGKILNIQLRYSQSGKREVKRVINDIKSVSKPGLRVYTKADKIPQSLDGLGITVLSTSKGLMTDREARRKRMGGEVLCKIW